MISQASPKQSQATSSAPSPMRYTPASPLLVMWLIAWRHISEGLRNRSTLVMTGFFVVLPLILVLFSLGSLFDGPTPPPVELAGTLLAVYLLMAGMMPTASAIGIAAAAFAGEKEQGSLTPLLATPASNGTIFTGKVLGALIPSVFSSAVSIIAYLVEVALRYGPDKLSYLPVTLTVLILLLVPATSLFGIGLAGFISSRVKTVQTANQYSSLIWSFLWIGLFFLSFKAVAWGLWIFGSVVAGVYVLAVLFIVVSVVTWRREEIMAKQ